MDSLFYFCLAEKRRGQTATLSIAAMVILVGLPLWWRTTETYRAWLPVSQIKEMANLQVCYISVLYHIIYVPSFLSVSKSLRDCDVHFVKSDSTFFFLAEVERRCRNYLRTRDCDTGAAEEGPTDSNAGRGTRCQRCFGVRC